MSDKLICGLDIGSTNVATVVSILDEDTDDLRVIGFNSTPSRGVRKGLIVDIEEVVSVVEESVEKAERMAGRKLNQAFISVGGPHISSLNSQGVVAVSNPQVEIVENDVRRVIEAAKAISLSSTREIIEVSPRDYVVDGQAGIKNPIGMTGVRLEVNTHIITASTTNLNNISRVLSDLGIENNGFIFSGLTSAEAILTPTERELGAVVVDIGGGKTDICVYIDGALAHSRSIPIGARHITNDIAVGLRISLESAERLKILLSDQLKSNREIPKKKNLKEFLGKRAERLVSGLDEITVKKLVTGIIYPRLEEIYGLLAEGIKESGFAENVPSGLIITGGGAKTVGILEVGKQVVGLPIRIGMPKGVSGLVDEILSPEFSTTVGLILYGRKNIIKKGEGGDDLGRLLRGFTFAKPINSLRQLFKQFIP